MLVKHRIIVAIGAGAVAWARIDPPRRSAQPVFRHRFEGRGANRLLIKGRIAFAAYPASPGCYPISGVEIRYRVGDSMFTKRMDGTDTVSTSSHGCRG